MSTNNAFGGYSVGDSIAVFKGNARPLTGGIVEKITAAGQTTVLFPKSGRKMRFSARGNEVGSGGSWSYNWHLTRKSELEKRLQAEQLYYDRDQFAQTVVKQLEPLHAHARSRKMLPDNRKEILAVLSQTLIALTESDAVLRHTEAAIELATKPEDL